MTTDTAETRSDVIVVPNKIGGERLTRLRETLLLSQSELAVFLGVHKNTIYNYESDGPKFKEREILKLRSVGINPLFLFGDKEYIVKGKCLSDVQSIIRKEVESLVSNADAI